jgi:hypothetical protein
MKDASKKPILITGAVRSGTTWVSKMIGFSPGVGFINEPFNPSTKKRPLGFYSVKFDKPYTYISHHNENEFFQDIKSALDFKYDYMRQLKEVQSYKNLGRFFMDCVYILYWQYLIKPRPLIKDPCSIFSAEWLFKKFDLDIIVLIRHPAAFVNSYKRINEPNRFKYLLKQEPLMKNVLSKFQKEIIKFSEKRYNIIDEAILMWKIFYYVINQYREKHKKWLFIRHEDLSNDPIEEFGKIYSYLSLKYTNKIKKKIDSYTNSSNPIEAPNGVLHQLKRNSKSNIFVWKKRLLKSEIKKIRTETEEIYSLFYPENYWK